MSVVWQSVHAIYDRGGWSSRGGLLSGRDVMSPLPTPSPVVLEYAVFAEPRTSLALAVLLELDASHLDPPAG